MARKSGLFAALLLLAAALAAAEAGDAGTQGPCPAFCANIGAAGLRFRWQRPPAHAPLISVFICRLRRGRASRTHSRAAATPASPAAADEPQGSTAAHGGSPAVESAAASAAQSSTVAADEPTAATEASAQPGDKVTPPPAPAPAAPSPTTAASAAAAPSLSTPAPSFSTPAISPSETTPPKPPAALPSTAATLPSSTLPFSPAPASLAAAAQALAAATRPLAAASRPSPTTPPTALPTAAKALPSIAQALAAAASAFPPFAQPSPAPPPTAAPAAAQPTAPRPPAASQPLPFFAVGQSRRSVGPCAAPHRLERSRLRGRRSRHPLLPCCVQRPGFWGGRQRSRWVHSAAHWRAGGTGDMRKQWASRFRCCTACCCGLFPDVWLLPARCKHAVRSTAALNANANAPACLQMMALLSSERLTPLPGWRPLPAPRPWSCRRGTTPSGRPSASQAATWRCGALG